MSWFLFIGFLLIVLFILGIICTLLYCIALVRYITNNDDEEYLL